MAWKGARMAGGATESILTGSDGGDRDGKRTRSTPPAPSRAGPTTRTAPGPGTGCLPALRSSPSRPAPPAAVPTGPRTPQAQPLQLGGQGVDPSAVQAGMGQEHVVLFGHGAAPCGLDLADPTPTGRSGKVTTGTNRYSGIGASRMRFYVPLNWMPGQAGGIR